MDINKQLQVVKIYGSPPYPSYRETADQVGLNQWQVLFFLNNPPADVAELVIACRQSRLRAEVAKRVAQLEEEVEGIRTSVEAKLERKRVTRKEKILQEYQEFWEARGGIPEDGWQEAKE